MSAIGTHEATRGCNLPQSACKGGWLLRGQLTTADLIDAQYAGALTGTGEQGFYILVQTPPRLAWTLAGWNLLDGLKFLS